MHTNELSPSLDLLFSELVQGAPEEGAFILNRGDQGLLRSLERLSAADASETHGSASVAAHVEHLRFGISLLNRWVAGENPFADADWTRAWQQTTVTDAEWASLQQGLRQETERWRTALATPREVTPVELNGMIASIAHLAYHLGAIRQVNAALRGPSAND